MTVTILRRARELYASAPDHTPIGQTPPEGCYCAVTAISAAAWLLLSSNEFIGAVRAVMVVASTTSLVHYNATHSTEEVLAAFDRAIEDGHSGQSV